MLSQFNIVFPESFNFLVQLLILRQHLVVLCDQSINGVAVSTLTLQVKSVLRVELNKIIIINVLS